MRQPTSRPRSTARAYFHYKRRILHETDVEDESNIVELTVNSGCDASCFAERLVIDETGFKDVAGGDVTRPSDIPMEALMWWRSDYNTIQDASLPV